MFGFFRSPRKFAPEFAPAICYSGYRDGQSPPSGIFPSYDEIFEDLQILARHWRYIRVYDCTPHAATVLRVIRDKRLPLKVMLGMGLQAEINNDSCPWGGVYPDDVLAANRRSNNAELREMIALSRKYRKEVLAVSIGNEASVDWNDHMVSVDRLIHFAKTLRRRARHPVTFCENYVPWTGKLDPLVPYLDVLSVHTYPVWEYKSIDEAMAYTEANFRAVKDRFPETPVVITEAGWTTRANGRGIEPHNASEDLQARYLAQLEAWSGEQGVITFVFEAFDESWKGSSDPDEPEKHWGVFTVHRKPKRAVAERFADLAEVR